MPKFQVQMKMVAVDTAKYFKYFDENLFKAIRESAADAAIEASSIVPVWSGMAKGSFLASYGRVKIYRMSKNYISSAAAIFNLVDSPQSIDISSHLRAFRTVTNRKANGSLVQRQRSTLQYLKSGEVKNKDAGARRATYTITTSPKGFKFTFESRVFHYNDEEVKAEWPSESFAIFKNLFDENMQLRKSEIVPNPTQYIFKTDVKDLVGKRLPRLQTTQVREEKYVSEAEVKSRTARLLERGRASAKKYRQKTSSAKNLLGKYKSAVDRVAKTGSKTAQLDLQRAVKGLSQFQGSKSKVLKSILKQVDFKVRL